MKKMTLDEIKKSEFEILCFIDGVCRDNDLRYTLVGGTLLGAVRHNGFIPWDDDIDIAMPRSDYERFIQICTTTESDFEVVSHMTNKEFKDIYSKVCDKRTEIEEGSTNRFGYKARVFVDLFPIDALGETFEEARNTYRRSSVWRELLVAANWKKYVKSKTRACYYELIRFPLFCLSRIVNPDTLIEKIEQTYLKLEFDKANYVAIVSGSYRDKEVFPKKVYEDLIPMRFEEKEFLCISNYDMYLSSIYGDYMKLPPAEKQVTHHTFEAYYI